MAWAPERGTLGFLRPERGRFSIACFFGITLTWHGDFAEAERALERALESAERSGSPGAKGAVLVEMAVVAFRRGEVASVRELLPRARAAATPC